MIADPFSSVILKGLDYQTPKMLKSHNSYSDSDSDSFSDSDGSFSNVIRFIILIEMVLEKLSGGEKIVLLVIIMIMFVILF